MTLAVGVVIDDAIVVLENIERHRERGADPRTAAATGHPRDRLRGHGGDGLGGRGLPAGRLRARAGGKLPRRVRADGGGLRADLALRRADAHADARRAHARRRRSAATAASTTGSSAASGRSRSGYARALHWTLHHRTRTALAALASLGLIVLFGSRLDTEFFPPSDQGIFFAKIEAAPGTSLEATTAYLAHDEQWFLAQPEVAGIFSAAGTEGGYSRTNETHKAMIFGTLVASRRTRPKRLRHHLVRAAGAVPHSRPRHPHLRTGRDDVHGQVGCLRGADSRAPSRSTSSTDWPTR